MSDYVVLVGAGPMAVEYAKVLTAEKIPFTVIGRGEKSAAEFREKTGISPLCGGLDDYLARNRAPECALVAVGVESLGATTRLLLEKGCRKILVEKPGGLNKAEIAANAALAAERNAAVLVAYNRRFYSSTQEARKIIREDGGVRSVHFDFTEWSHRIRDVQKAPGVKDAWFCGNSTHVVDLAFYLAGFPAEMTCFHTGGLDWHPASAVFAGAGVTDSGALFSYRADWESAGRWGVEVFTRKRRLLLCPLEKLQQQLVGSLAVTEVPCDDADDIAFKPGLKKEVTAFLGGDWTNFCTLAEQSRKMAWYNQMAGYEEFAGKDSVHR